MSTTQVYRFVKEIWIDAPPERVYRAFTEPDEVTAWWGVPGAYETTDAEIDLRVGGSYRFSGTSARSGTFEVRGEYRELDPPRRLVYTWTPGWDDGADRSVVAITLEERDGGTVLTLEHTGFRTASARDEHDQGWPAVMAALRTHVEAGG